MLVSLQDESGMRRGSAVQLYHLNENDWLVWDDQVTSYIMAESETENGKDQA